MATALVTGATGLLGAAAVDHMIRKGYTVTATDIPSADFSRVRGMGAAVEPLDITDAGGVKKIIAGKDVVIHTAGVFDFGASKDLLWKVNVEAVHHVARACMDHGVKRLVQYSSVGVYGRPRHTPCRESDPKHPRNLYEQSKWEGEKAAMSYAGKGLPVTALRPSLVYGPRSRYGWAMHICMFASMRAAGRTKIVGLRGGPLSQSVHVEDVARATVLLAEAKDVAGRSFNVADDSPIPLGDAFRAITDPLGMTVVKEHAFRPYLYIPLMRVTEWLNTVIRYNPFEKQSRKLQRHWETLRGKYGLTRDLTPRIDKDWIGYGGGDHLYDMSGLKSLGFTAAYPDFRSGMRDTIAWYQANKWIPSFPAA